jgi:hypothetical protein
MFDKWQAQVWWGENFDRLRELYNVQTFNRQALNNTTPPPSEDEVNIHNDVKILNCFCVIILISNLHCFLLTAERFFYLLEASYWRRYPYGWMVQ